MKVRTLQSYSVVFGVCPLGQVVQVGHAGAG